MNRLIALTGLVVAVASCSPHTVNKKPVPTVPVPSDFGDRPAGVELSGPWWRAFDDAELSRLVDRAFADNLDLHEARARLDQAAAGAGIAASAAMPQLSAEAGSDRGRDITGTTASSYSWSVAASYEVDLWKRIASSRDAATQDALAARDDAEAAAMSVAASVAESWYDLVHERARAELIGRQIATNETLHDLVRARFAQGLASSVDVFQQRQRVHEVSAQLALSVAGQHRAANQLAVLLGEPPERFEAGDRAALPPLPLFPETGVPGDLLERRPDIRAARRRVVAADYRVAAAIADRLPSIRLTASASDRSSDASDLASNPLWNLAAGIFAPILDGGRRAREVDRNRAVVRERAAQYARSLLDALREVEDALISEGQQLAFIGGVDRALAAASGALAESRNRYREGLSDYLPVLTAVTAQQDLELTRLSAERNLISFRIQLYRALGGDWTRTALYRRNER